MLTLEDFGLRNFEHFVDVMIVYRLQKTVLKYRYYLPRYDKPSMGTDCDITPCPKSSNPYFWKKNLQIFLKFCPVLGNHMYSCLKT